MLPIIKVALPICFALFCISHLKAQTKAENVVVNLGPYSGYGHQQRKPFTETSGIPAISTGAEYFFNKYFGVGSYITYTYVYDKFVGSTEMYKDVWRGWDIGSNPLSISILY